MKKKMELAWTHVKKKWWQHHQTGATVDTTRTLGKRASNEYLEKRSGERNVDSRIQVQLEEDRGGSTRQFHAMNTARRQVAADHWTKPTSLSHRPTYRQPVIRIHRRRHFLLLPSPKADAYFTVPQRVEGWVDLMICKKCVFKFRLKPDTRHLRLV